MVGCEDCPGSTLFCITKPQPSAIAQAHDKDMAQGGRTPRITDLAAWALDLRCSRWQWEKQGTTPPVRTWTPQARTLLPRLPGLSRGVYPPAPGPKARRGQVPCYAVFGETTRNSASGLLAPGME